MIRDKQVMCKESGIIMATDSPAILQILEGTTEVSSKYRMKIIFSLKFDTPPSVNQSEIKMQTFCTCKAANITSPMLLFSRNY